MRKETTFGTCPTPSREVGAGACPLLSLAECSETNWTEDFLQAVNSSSTTTPLKTDVRLGVVQESLNTPTMELREPMFPLSSSSSSSLIIIPQEEEEAPTSILSPSDQTILADLNLEVVDASLPSTSNLAYNNHDDLEFNIPDASSANIEDVWGCLGSPAMQAVPLLDVEGRGGGATLDDAVVDDTNKVVAAATFDAPVEVTKEEATDDRDLLNWAMETSEVLNPVQQDNKDNIFATLDTSQLQLFADYRPSNYSDDSPVTLLSPLEDNTMSQPTSIINNVNSDPPATVTSQTAAPASSFGPMRPARATRNPARFSTTTSPLEAAAASRPPAKRGRGRPPVAPGRAITPRVSRAGKIVSGSESDGLYISDGNLTDAEISDFRYRRMRDLNNEASKRCRENRKTKFQMLEEELNQLKARNLELTTRWRRLEAAVQKIKQQYVQFIAQGSQGPLPQLPDVAQLWSDIPKQE